MVIFMAKSGKYSNVCVVKKLAKSIIDYRKKNKLSREKLALNIDVSPRQLSSIEACESKCKIDTLQKIVNGIGVDIKYILGYDEDGK